LPPVASLLIRAAGAVRFNTMNLRFVPPNFREVAVMVRRLLACVAPFAALVAVLSTAGTARAIGYWNVPGTFCQCAGYGWGAGHHACYVLGPINCRDCFDHGEVRLPYAPQPPYACYGGGTYNYDFRQPGQYAPVEYQTMPQDVVPTTDVSTPEATLPEPAPQSLTPDPLPMPERSIPEPSAPSRPLFDSPVER
jgi:hypothetical protein